MRHLMKRPPGRSVFASPMALLVAAGAACSGTLTAVALTGQPAGVAARVPIVIGNPVEGSNGFGVVTEEEATLGSTESEGPVVVGGDLTFGAGYNVALNTAGGFTAPGDARPTALLVGGRVDFAGSDPGGVLRVLDDGYVKIGDESGSTALNQDPNGASVNTQVVAEGSAYNSTPRIELTVQQPVGSVFQSGLMDFPSLFSVYRDRADRMAGCATDVTLLDGEGNPLDPDDITPGTDVQVSLTSGRTNVLRLTGEQLNDIAEITFLDRPTADTPLLVNVDTTATAGVFTWDTPTPAGISNAEAPYILWNFADATSITIATGDSVEGTIFAPRADLVDLDPSNIEGDVIVKTLVAGPLSGPSGEAVNAGEIHYHPFAAELQCDSDIGATPSPSDSGSPSPSPSPSDSGSPSPSPSPSDSGSPSPSPSPSGTGSPPPSPSPSGSGSPTPGPSHTHPTPRPPKPHPPHPEPGYGYGYGSE
ncbi:collagen-binding domain-containing protein [Streptomyces sp. NPDC002640]